MGCGNLSLAGAVTIWSVGRDEMIIFEIDLAQKAIALAAGRDVLHCRRTDWSEVREAVVGERIIHPGSLEIREGRRSFAPDPIPFFCVLIWICSEMKNSGVVEIACFYNGSGAEVIAAEGCFRAGIRR